MHQSSEGIGRIATALAKAQAELSNPERTLTATILARDGERTFRYASLANGLDLVRKCLGQNEIAVMQTTAVDQGQIMLTTLLVHTSGEWVSSIWPVCPTAESSAHTKGAALTYARRYALFTIVGIAGEDDLDAPDLISQAKPPASEPPPLKSNRGAVHSPRPNLLGADQSAALRDRLLTEISTLVSEDALAVWAYKALPLKSTLTREDSQSVELAYLDQVSQSGGSTPLARSTQTSPAQQGIKQSGDVEFVNPLTKPVRKRSKAHLFFVASQPCLICNATPCDAHHVKIAQPRSLGRKVSDEFTVPLCRAHHRELHRHGNEQTWWTNVQIEPLPIAKELWETSPVHGISTAAPNEVKPKLSGKDAARQ
jgi:hypothetical protein